MPPKQSVPPHKASSLSAARSPWPASRHRTPHVQALPHSAFEHGPRRRRSAFAGAPASSDNRSPVLERASSLACLSKAYYSLSVLDPFERCAIPRPGCCWITRRRARPMVLVLGEREGHALLRLPRWTAAIASRGPQTVAIYSTAALLRGSRRRFWRDFCFERAFFAGGSARESFSSLRAPSSLSLCLRKQSSAPPPNAWAA